MKRRRKKKPSRGEAIDEMIKGCKALVGQLYGERLIQGAISFGGAEGGVMAAKATSAARGIPKSCQMIRIDLSDDLGARLYLPSGDRRYGCGRDGERHSYSSQPASI